MRESIFETLFMLNKNTIILTIMKNKLNIKEYNNKKFT